MNQVLEVPGTQSSIAIALLAAAVGTGLQPRDRRAVLEVMTSRRDTHIVLGAGAVCLGPAERYAYFVTRDPTYLESALAFADRTGSVLWSTVLLTDLVRLESRTDLAERCDSLRRLIGLEPL